MFELEGPASEILRPASKRDMLAALLAVLRDTSWARAVRCPAEPAFMTPISCATALGRTALASEVRTVPHSLCLALKNLNALYIACCSLRSPAEVVGSGAQSRRACEQRLSAIRTLGSCAPSSSCTAYGGCWFGILSRRA